MVTDKENDYIIKSTDYFDALAGTRECAGN